MAVAVTGLPAMHPLAQRDGRDPFAFASWSLGLTHDGSGGFATHNCALRLPDVVIWPTLMGMSAAGVNVQSWLFRGFETWNAVGAGVSRNIELPLSYAAQTPARAAMGLLGPFPWWIASDPTNLSYVVLEGVGNNTAASTSGLTLLAYLYSFSCLNLGGPRTPGS